VYTSTYAPQSFLLKSLPFHLSYATDVPPSLLPYQYPVQLPFQESFHARIDRLEPVEEQAREFVHVLLLLQGQGLPRVLREGLREEGREGGKEGREENR
jgi:hypothetical protein